MLLNIEHTPPTQFFPNLSFCKISLLLSFIEKKKRIQFLLHPCLKQDIGGHNTIPNCYASKGI